MSNVIGEGVVRIREFKLDLTENARITSPGSFRRLENLWSPQPGAIEQRPGSQRFAWTWKNGATIASDDWRNTPGTGTQPGYPTNTDVLIEPDVVQIDPDQLSDISDVVTKVQDALQTTVSTFDASAGGDVIYRLTF